MNEIYTKWSKIDDIYYPMNENNEVCTHTNGYTEVEEFYEGISKVSDGNKWGCFNSVGELIVPIKYDTIDYRKNNSGMQILCGRDGIHFTGKKGSSYSNEDVSTIYTGVYDLYDINGDLLLGGFDEYNFDEKTMIYHFFFGRNWETHKKESQWEASFYNYSDNQGKWLLLTEDLKFPFKFHIFPQWGQGANCSDASVKGQVVTHRYICFAKIADDMFPIEMIDNMKWTDRQGSHSTMLIDFPGIVLFDEIKQ